MRQNARLENFLPDAQFVRCKEYFCMEKDSNMGVCNNTAHTLVCLLVFISFYLYTTFQSKESKAVHKIVINHKNKTGEETLP